MNENAIIIDYDPFAMESRISIYNNGAKEYTRVYSDLEEMVDGIINLSYEHKIYNIKVHGPFAISSELKKAISKSERVIYSQNKISVEGI